MDFKKIGKVALPIASVLLAGLSAVISNKQTEETIGKKVAEALAKQAEGES